MQRIFTALSLVLLLNAVGIAEEDAELFKVIHAKAVHRCDGTVVSPGTVVIRGHRILAVGPDLPLPEGALAFTLEGESHLTAGLIDAAATVGVGSKRSWAEQASEVIPELFNLDALDLTDKAFQRLAAQGVTTVYVSPDASSVIGCRGVVVKTGGTGDRVVQAQAALKASFGPEGWRRGSRNRGPRGHASFLTRRPTTRMGMAWVFRKAFYDAKEYQEQRGAEPDPSLEVLVQVLDGKIPLRIQAREDIDIWSAVRMAREFGLKFVLEEGTEAYRCIPELKAYGVPVIFGPVYVDPTGSRARSGEYLRPCLNTAGLLWEAGIKVALTGGDLSGEGTLPRQAGYAIRAGLPFEEALKAATLHPAQLLGLDDRLGDLKPGADADLVLWTGKPFSATAKPALVLIGGQVVYKDKHWIK